MTPRLKTKYLDEVVPKLKEQFEITNVHALPKLEKIVLSVGLGKQIEGTKLNAKAKEQTIKDLTVISGQKPIMTIARKSVSNFKVREGYENGCRVTIRGDRMWEFFDRLISLAIPRIKDFRGLPVKSFDKGGSYSFGIVEQGIFPEVDMTNAQFTHGMHVTFVWSGSSPEKTRLAMTEMGFPFRKPEEKKKVA